MSWTDYIVKFNNCEMVGVDWLETVELSKKYGVLIPSLDSNSKLHELTMDEPFGVVHFHGNKIEGINMVSIDRPTESGLIRPFIFDFLIAFDMVLCDQNFTAGVSTTNLKQHIPKNTLLEGVKIIKTANEIYP